MNLLLVLTLATLATLPVSASGRHWLLNTCLFLCVYLDIVVYISFVDDMMFPPSIGIPFNIIIYNENASYMHVMHP